MGWELPPNRTTVFGWSGSLFSETAVQLGGNS
jgi:hypothetical protein